MSTNKEYRNHEYGEDISYKLSDIIDVIEECQYDLKSWNNIESMRSNLLKLKDEIDWILERI